MSGATPFLKHDPAIDGLRAVAVIAVIVNHFSKALMPGGHLGVDIFFVISGYVIATSLYRSTSSTLSEFLLEFYAKRLKRLAPALALCVTVTGALICLFDPEPAASLKTGIAALFGLSNLYLLRISADYFAVSSDLNPFTHTWSLGVEEQFYFVFPLLFWVLLIKGGRQASKGSAIGALAVLSLLSLAAYVHVGEKNSMASFFLAPLRFWELATGAILFLLGSRLQFKWENPGLILNIALVLLVSTLFLSGNHSSLETIVAVALTAVVIVAIRNCGAESNLLTSQLAVKVGLISYSLYLWHWSVLSISRWTIGVDWWTVPIQIILMTLAAILSYRYVEKPLRYARWPFSLPGTIGYAVAFLTGIAALQLVLLKPLNGKLFLGVENRVDHSASSSQILKEYADVVKDVEQRVATCNMTPQYLTGAAYRPQPVVDQAFLQKCLANPEGKKKILVVGDSFARASAAHIAVAAHRAGYDFRLLFGYGCPYPFPFKDVKGGQLKNCGEIQEDLLSKELVSALGPGDLLVVRLYWPKPQYLAYGAGELPSPGAYDHAILELAKAAASRGAKLFIIGANPTLSLLQVQSLTPQWFKLSPPQSFIGPLENPETAYFHLLDEHLKRLLATTEGATFFSVTPHICESSLKCRIFSGDRPLYFDRQHLSPHAFDLFFKDLATHLDTSLH